MYFIGIGGIGMSALARYFKSQGVHVSGYDKTETDLTRALVGEGIPVHYTDDVHQAPKDADLVVYTPAVPAEHTELNFYRDGKFAVVKRSDVLGAITKEGYGIAIAGTHGKTTTTTMAAHILRHAGVRSTAFLGGIASNYNTNYWSTGTDAFVVEADEYDRSFLKLQPAIAVITSMDPDHLDIYGTEEAMQDAFVAFGNGMQSEGLLIHKFGLKRVREISVSRKWSYSLQNDAADVHAKNLRIEDGGYHFDVVLPGGAVTGLHLAIGGMHNVENAIAAIAVAHAMEIDESAMRAAIGSFKGVKRRFEYILPPGKKEAGEYVYPVMIDDYAHHPEELAALLKSARSLFPQRRITVIFQPHLFSRTKDLAGRFSKSLELADRVILLPIYPARELPMEGVSSEMILQPMGTEDKQVLSKEQLLDWAKEHVKNIDKEFGEVIITAGAGDIDMLVQPLKEILEKG